MSLRGVVGAGVGFVVAVLFALSPLASGAGARADPPPAGIAFESAGRILTIASDGSDRQQLSGGRLVHPRRGDDYLPAWSPDRSRLAFVHSAGRRGDRRTWIYVMNADGTHRHAVTPGRGEFEADPDWSPDGQSIAFTRWIASRRHLVTKIVVTALDGSGEHTVVREEIDEWSPPFVLVSEPAWSPDGSEIAFTRTILKENGIVQPSVHVVNANGSGDALLRKRASEAAWSPDGSMLAFSSVRDRNGTRCGYDLCSFAAEIYVMQADGSHPLRLTDETGDDAEPDWSADGQRITFASDRNYPGAPEVYSIQPDGSCLTWLTNGSPSSESPDWEPDAAASTDPGACGPTRRPPLVEFRAKPARKVRDFRPLWLGQHFHGLLLSDVDASRHRAGFGYRDCARYFPSRCRRPVDVENYSVCPFTLLEIPLPSTQLFERRGSLLAFFVFKILAAYTGGAQLIVYGGRSNDQSRLDADLAAFRRLRHLSDSEPPATLAPPALPEDLLREVRQALDAYERLGSVKAVARELDESERRVRNRLQLGRALAGFDHVRSVDCPEPYPVPVPAKVAPLHKTEPAPTGISPPYPAWLKPAR